ncbi:transmembrane protein, putative (macronuclear) [Tetrahymena thermophila SB210]|uniref:Transmembrane protein, putative n=1 Tax=Tetrahymena thermophila (strain SB210) TaxID=312017 RepID=Q245C9_TETTS|nr:transmembrane protein, putative [Tetrahymena thermophila SB210]EAS03435.2 transmembrane protein, putative [Tetrahymena thermophila SB210]|eukprot:XP_001023680.2 transmembrane protein, putative [Tetrahymena thermophila SB210]
MIQKTSKKTDVVAQQIIILGFLNGCNAYSIRKENNKKIAYQLQKQNRMKSPFQQQSFIELIIPVKKNQNQACAKCEDRPQRPYNSNYQRHITLSAISILNQKSLASTHHNSNVHLKKRYKENPLKEYKEFMNTKQLIQKNEIKVSHSAIYVYFVKHFQVFVFYSPLFIYINVTSNLKEMPYNKCNIHPD